MLKMGRIFQLQVTKYFLFRESLKFSDKDLGENERNFLSQSRPWERSLQQQNAGAPDNSSIFFQNELLGHFFVIFHIPTRPIWMIVQVISQQGSQVSARSLTVSSQLGRKRKTI